MQPPVAKQVPVTLARHAGAVVDPYAWLRDRDDPDTIGYLKAENTYAERWFAPLQPLRERLFEEIRSRTKETDLSVPVPYGPWDYYVRTEEGLDYPIHCRRALDDPTAPEHVMLDENVEAGDLDYFELGVLAISPDHGLIAWSADRDGSEDYELRFRDLATGVDLADRIELVSAGGAWASDGPTFLYVRHDEAKRPFEVWRHRLGTPGTDDVRVHQELDERFWLDVDRTRRGRYLVLSIASKTTAEAWLVPADAPDTPPVLVEPRVEGHEYDVDEWDDGLVIVTNADGAEDFKVMTAPSATPGQAHWRELVPHVPGQRIMGVDPFAGYLVVHEWVHGVPRLRVLFADGAERVLTFATEAHDVKPDANLDYGAARYRFRYEAMATPACVMDEDVRTGDRRLLKQTPVLGDWDPARYVTSRRWAPSVDGTLVPLDVVHHVDTPLDGTAGCLLYAYGAYEISMPTYFSVARLSLLDRGVVFALAHPRGGGELGRRWYLDGKLEHKQRTFDDVIACAVHLHETGYVAPGRLALRGGSAGGLMVGAVVNQRPDLFSAAVAEVPFVDVVTTMSDPTLPLTITEWEEWGDPRGPEFEAIMAAYSPYDNVRAVAYPSLYVTAGFNDPRVSYHEPAKWVAKLRAIAGAAGSGPLLLRTELEAGHGGPSGRYDAWRDEARTLAFVLVHVGAEAAPG